MTQGRPRPTDDRPRKVSLQERIPRVARRQALAMLLGKARVIRVMLVVRAAPKTRRQNIIVLSLYAASGSAIRDSTKIDEIGVLW